MSKQAVRMGLNLALALLRAGGFGRVAWAANEQTDVKGIVEDVMWEGANSRWALAFPPRIPSPNPLVEGKNRESPDPGPRSSSIHRAFGNMEPQASACLDTDWNICAGGFF